MTLWDSLFDTLEYYFIIDDRKRMLKRKKDEPSNMDSSSLTHFDC
ncbi:hypothetical protein [uncultured Eubacterium sp.]|nr:hypothetical protein [uncultured Eubacterium sp.]